jgi:NADH:ubiquinone reductase (H+-translocating)
VETDRAGRVRIQNDLTVPGHPDIYVIGDTASLEQDGKPLPGVAQVAIQQSRYAGRRIAQSLLSKPSPKPFRYFDKGTWPLLERVSQSFKQLSPAEWIVAWLAWAGVHLQFLATGQSASHRVFAVNLEFLDRSDRGSVDRESHSYFQAEEG